ncbi:hypothetical protein [Methylomonas sp. AM2-LC]|uniref:hypothetical protein n=1 Tax=Methylomonas sp. AM2-LC TaxID=3153301 RepID=UPI003264E218
MHSLLPYSIRCYNPSLTGDSDSKNKYALLDKIGQFDVYNLLKSYIDSHINFKIVEEHKQVFRFNSVVFNSDKRIIYGWLQVGMYGIKTDIINIDTGEVDFEKAVNNAEVINHFVYFYLPKNLNKGIALLHAHGLHGVKTLFFELFSKYFNQVTKLNLQMNPLSYEKAVNKWMDGNIVEIRLNKFDGWKDRTDALFNGGSNEHSLIIKSIKKGKISNAIGQFKDCLNKNSDTAKAIEVLSSHCSQVKTVVALGKQTRIFTVGNSEAHTMYSIEAPDELKLVDGNPEYTAIQEWCEEISTEFFNELFPGVVMYPSIEVP